MPYRTIDELPKAQTRKYSTHQKRAFRRAFNSAVYDQGLPEKNAFRIAHSAAKNAARERDRFGDD